MREAIPPLHVSQVSLYDGASVSFTLFLRDVLFSLNL